MEMDKKIILSEFPQFCSGKIQCLHFISMFIAQKLITGLIIQYISLNNYKIVPKCNTFTEMETLGNFGFVTFVFVISSPKQKILIFVSFFYQA
jgi:hypothetical protein